MSDFAQPTDRQPVPGALLTDLDLALVQRHITIAKERGRYDGPAEPNDAPAMIGAVPSASTELLVLPSQKAVAYTLLSIQDKRTVP